MSQAVSCQDPSTGAIDALECIRRRLTPTSPKRSDGEDRRHGDATTLAVGKGGSRLDGHRLSRQGGCSSPTAVGALPIASGSRKRLWGPLPAGTFVATAAIIDRPPNRKGARDVSGDGQQRRRTQSLGEEIANSVSHGVGLLVALIAAPVLVIDALQRGDTAGIVGASVFAATMVLL